jgi:sarcosine oxidase subunit alpha
MTTIPSPGLRAAPSPFEVIDRKAPVRFTFNGRPVAALAGDTIVSALMAGGIRSFAQGRRLQTRRGVLTADRFDPSCFLQVDDEPNVPGAHRLVVDGMRVRSQHVWPSLRFDLKAINQRASRLLRPTSQLRASTASGFLRPAYRWLTAHGDVAGRVSTAGRREQRVRHLHPDILVVGGGLAGLAAADAASAAGARTLLIEADRAVGGSLRLVGEPLVAEFQRTLAQRDGVDVWTDAVVCSLDPEGLALVVTELPGGAEELAVVHAAHVILAWGMIERTLTFAGNDLPGVMLAGGARRLVNLWAVRPGRRAVVLTANDHGDAAAAELDAAGVEVIKIVDSREGAAIRRAEGTPELDRVHLADGSALSVDLLVVAAGWTLDAAFLARAGARVNPNRRRGRPSVEGRPGSLTVVGALAGDGPLEQVVAHATVSGRQAAAASARRLRSVAGPQPSGAAVEGRRATPPQPPLGDRGGDQAVTSVSVGVVDFAEDLTAYELVDSDPVKGARLLTRAASSPASNPRARVELSDLAWRLPAVAPLAEPLLMGQATPMCSLTGGVRLGSLAGLAPSARRVTPLADEHAALGGRLVPEGEWLDVSDYGQPEDERRALLEGVALRDTSRSAVFDLQGLDAPDLLHGLLPGRRLPRPHEVRVATSPEGWSLAIAGVGVEHWELRVDAADALAVEARLLTLLHIEHRQWEAFVTPLAESQAAMTLLGPRAAELAQRLLGRPPGEAAVTAMGESGPGPGRMWSFAWKGLPALELRVAAGHAAAVWRALLAAGEDLGIRPVGLLAVEALSWETASAPTMQPTESDARPVRAASPDA